MLWATPAEAWDLWKLLQRVYLGIRWLRLLLENEEQDLRRGRGELGREGAQLSRPAHNREGSPEAQELRRESSQPRPVTLCILVKRPRLANPQSPRCVTS